jgi:hypothetical protein
MKFRSGVYTTRLAENATRIVHVHVTAAWENHKSRVFEPIWDAPEKFIPTFPNSIGVQKLKPSIQDIRRNGCGEENSSPTGRFLSVG